jgi:hypothetical protein
LQERHPGAIEKTRFPARQGDAVTSPIAMTGRGEIAALAGLSEIITEESYTYCILHKDGGGRQNRLEIIK